MKKTHTLFNECMSNITKTTYEKNKHLTQMKKK